jgi:hypothetical protein
VSWHKKQSVVCEILPTISKRTVLENIGKTAGEADVQIGITDISIRKLQKNQTPE